MPLNWGILISSLFEDTAWAKAVNGKGPTQKWWVKIQTKNKKVGWIDGHSPVTGSDKFE